MKLIACLTIALLTFGFVFIVRDRLVRNRSSTRN